MTFHTRPRSENSGRKTLPKKKCRLSGMVLWDPCFSYRLRFFFDMVYFLTNDLSFIWHEVYNSSYCHNISLDIECVFLITTCYHWHVIVTLGSRGALMCHVLASLGHSASLSSGNTRGCRALGHVVTMTNPVWEPLLFPLRAPHPGVSSAHVFTASCRHGGAGACRCSTGWMCHTGAWKPTHTLSFLLVKIDTSSSAYYVHSRFVSLRFRILYIKFPFLSIIIGSWPFTLSTRFS